jgi:hypothetical protein
MKLFFWRFKQDAEVAIKRYEERKNQSLKKVCIYIYYEFSLLHIPLIQWCVMICRPCFNRFWELKYIPRLFSKYMLTFRAEEPITNTWSIQQTLIFHGCTITNKQKVEPWKLSTSWGHTKVLFLTIVFFKYNIQLY